MAWAIASCEIPIGLRYSSKRISPGVIGVFIRTSVWMSIWFFLAAQLPHLQLLYHPLAENQSYFVYRVHPRFGVGTVWRGISASGGWNCLRSLGETQCRRQAWPYGGARQLGRVRGQAQGRRLRGPDGTGGTWSGKTLSIGHLLRMSTPGR